MTLPGHQKHMVSAPFMWSRPWKTSRSWCEKLPATGSAVPARAITRTARRALELIRLQPSLDAVLAQMGAGGRPKPRIVVTSARMESSNLSYVGLRELAQTDTPVALLFGTAWGLADEILAAADFRLAPIAGNSTYNHLAVRSAVSIILDRMLGDDR